MEKKSTAAFAIMMFLCQEANVIIIRYKTVLISQTKIVYNAQINMVTLIIIKPVYQITITFYGVHIINTIINVIAVMGQKIIVGMIVKAILQLIIAYRQQD